MLRAAFALFSLILAQAPPQAPAWPREAEQPLAPKPAAAPSAMAGYLGEYGPESAPVIVFEAHGELSAVVGRGTAKPLAAGAFALDSRGRAVRVTIDGQSYDRRDVGPADGGQLHVTPLRPVPELLKAAQAETPPAEPGNFLPADLVELVRVDGSIRLDIRYATTNNFLGSVFYAEGRAFLQRPAAEAVARAANALRPLGYGLLVHDGYRPWYVTKTFWDATPEDKKWLVANPAKGSNHNRGCAIDLTLYDLATGRVIEMPSTYDESTPRAYAFYPGGTDLERWHRALLRRVMEAEGFTVNPNEWWHFDYKDWRRYAIGNVAFDRIPASGRRP